MAFEPLNTDEKLPPGTKREKDMDAQMLAGCSSFVVVSIATYMLTVWPFFAFTELEKISTLVRCCAFGMGPAAIVGGVAARKFGLAAAFGFVGGAVSTTIFLYLRIQATFIAAMAEQLPPPDYPSALIYLVPGLWLTLTIFMGLVLLKKGEIPLDEE